jgi:hypothetical protein
VLVWICSCHCCSSSGRVWDVGHWQQRVRLIYLQILLRMRLREHSLLRCRRLLNLVVLCWDILLLLLLMIRDIIWEFNLRLWQLLLHLTKGSLVQFLLLHITVLRSISTWCRADRVQSHWVNLMLFTVYQFFIVNGCPVGLNIISLHLSEIRSLAQNCSLSLLSSWIIKVH